ncbi:MAG: secondary thiamine-phosphate synthase enzyme YjbQ [Kiritimatiellia bacterium]|nr:secondary thiamine-phosphate synthase enzyme YjbQ [Lentisphaerota bacterium]
MNHQNTITIRTTGHRDMHDITDQVARIVTASGILTGIAHIFNVGSTACIGTIEYESGLAADLPAMLDRLIPPNRDYGHEQTWHDGNGHSHLQATWMGPSLTVPVSNGQAMLGTWQQIFLLECDIKPRQREIVVTVQGQ